jgi:hypothetical protein
MIVALIMYQAKMTSRPIRAEYPGFKKPSIVKTVAKRMGPMIPAHRSQRWALLAFFRIILCSTAQSTSEIAHFPLSFSLDSRQV